MSADRNIETLEMKISGTGWLCVLANGVWWPIFRLTDAQLREWRKLTF